MSRRNKVAQLATATAVAMVGTLERQAEEQRDVIHEHENILHGRMLDSELRHRQDIFNRPLTYEERLDAFDHVVQRFREVREVIRGERPIEVQPTPIPEQAGVGFARTPDSPDIPPPDPDFYGLNDPNVQAQDIPIVPPPPTGTLDDSNRQFGV